MITFIGIAVSRGSAFAWPSAVNMITAGGCFGPNFEFFSTVPEPSTWAMMILGFGATGVSVRRRKSLAVA